MSRSSHPRSVKRWVDCLPTESHSSNICIFKQIQDKINKSLIFSKLCPKIICDVTQFVSPNYPYVLDIFDFLESFFKNVCACMCV